MPARSVVADRPKYSRGTVVIKIGPAVRPCPAAPIARIDDPNDPQPGSLPSTHDTNRYRQIGEADYLGVEVKPASRTELSGPVRPAVQLRLSIDKIIGRQVPRRRSDGTGSISTRHRAAIAPLPIRLVG